MRKELCILPLAALLLLAGCGQSSTTTDSHTSVASDTREDKYTSPTPAKAQRRDIVGYEFLKGDLLTPPEAQAVAYAVYETPVEQVMTSVGQSVRKGEVLVKLSSPQAQVDYNEAQANVKAAQVALGTAKAQAEAPVRQLQSQLSALRAKERSLRQSTDPSGDATALTDATTERQNVEQQLIQARAQADQQLVQYQQQLASAQAVLNGAKAGTKFANITAPITGTVVKLDVQPGQTVKSGQSVATIVDLAALRVQSELTDEQAGIVKQGMPVVIKFKDLPNQPFDGSVRSVRTLPENGDVERVADIPFRNREGLIKPGMGVGSIGVQTGKATQVVAVPVQAVDKDEKGRPIVQVMVGKDWEKRVVETGLSDGDYIEIKSGVKEDDTVLVTP